MRSFAWAVDEFGTWWKYWWAPRVLPTAVMMATHLSDIHCVVVFPYCKTFTVGVDIEGYGRLDLLD